MLEFKRGDIFTENVEALVNSVNCVGIMGRGIALQFKNTFPDNFKAYADACQRKEVQPGRMFVFETGLLDHPRYIFNFPTKRHWRGKSRMEDIESGLKALAQEIKERDIRSIAIPPLGSDLGGLEWAEVCPRIEEALGALSDLKIVILEPGSGPPADRRANRSSNVPPMTAGRAALVGLIHRYLGGLLDPSMTLPEVHKLMYFMQEAGESLKLKYEKGPYGPYAKDLRRVLRKIEGHLISGYTDKGDARDKELELVPGALRDAEAFLEGHPETRSRFDRVAGLVEGFESSFGLELLATVHWVASHDQASTEDEIIAGVYEWGERKRQFSERQIRLALRDLREKGWLSGSSPPLPEELKLLRRELGKMGDHQSGGGKGYPMEAVLSLAVLGWMCGQRSIKDIYRFGDANPQLLSLLGLSRSPSAGTLSKRLRGVPVAEVRQALLSFITELRRLPGEDQQGVPFDGKTYRGMCEEGEQLKMLDEEVPCANEEWLDVYEECEQLKQLHLFSQEGALVLEQLDMAHAPDGPDAALQWIQKVSERFEGLAVLTGDSWTKTGRR